MHIAFISQYFYPEQFSNNDIVKDLIKRENSVEVICCVPNYPAGSFFENYSNSANRDEIWEGAKVHRCWTMPRGKKSWQLLLNYLVFPISGSWTALTKFKKKPDVCFVSMPSPLFQAFVGVFIKKTRKTPLVYWVQDLWPESAILTIGIKNKALIKFLNIMCGWLYKQADIILVQSEAFPKKIERFGIPREKIKILPNTAPKNYHAVSRNDKKAKSVSKHIPQTEFNLMFAGNIGESQDFDTLIKAAEILKNDTRLNWSILGSGRDLNRVKTVLKNRGLDNLFHFLGRHPEESMPYFFANADAMIVSLKSNEIFELTVPYKIQCYMACGKPIIASLDGEGARIIKESKSGFVAAAEKPEDLAAQIKKMLDLSSKEKQTLSINSRQYFEDKYANNIVYENLSTWLKNTSQNTTIK